MLDTSDWRIVQNLRRRDRHADLPDSANEEKEDTSMRAVHAERGDDRRRAATIPRREPGGVRAGRPAQRGAADRRGLGLRRRAPPVVVGHRGAGRGPRVHGHRRALHGVQGAHRWLLGDRGRRSRCGARMGQEGHPRLWSLSRCGRSRRILRSDAGRAGDGGRSGDRAHLPPGVRPGGLGPDPGLRRHRSRRGWRAGRLHRRRAAVARGRTTPEPRRLDHHHGTPPDTRPAATRGLPRRPPDPGRCASRPGRGERRRNSPCGTTAFA